MLHLLFAYSFLLLCCGYAVRSDDWPERKAAYAILAAVMATTIAYALMQNRYLRLDLAIMAIDLMLLGALIRLALEADRFWLIPVTAFHAITIIGHLLKLMEPDLPPLLYKLLLAFPIYPMLILLTWGTRRATVRRALRTPRSYQLFFPSVASMIRKLQREPS